MLVLAYHLFPGLLPGGFLGVDIFFVVSGYLITALLLAEHRRDGRIDLRRFWARRARRLLPALVLVVMTTATLAALIGGDVLVGMGWQLLGAVTFTSNWVAIGAGASYLDQTSPELLRHLWSLAVEEQFYLLWPIALLALLASPLGRRMRAAILLALAVASALAMAATAGVPAIDGGQAASAAYLSSLTHGFGLLAGAALALWRDPLSSPRPLVGRAASTPALTAAGTLVLVAVVLSIDGVAAYRGGLAAAVALTAVAILALEASSARGGVAARLADSRPVRWIGERSYSLYLWHWPLWVLALALAPTIDRTSTDSWLIGLAVAAASVVLADATYRFLERPMRERTVLAPVLTGPARRRVAVAVVATLAIGALTLGTAAALQRSPVASEAAELIVAGEQAVADAAETTDDAADPATTPEPSADATETPEPPADPSPAASPEEHAEPEPEPEPAPLPTGDQIVAFGDSVMLAAAPALLEEFPGIDVDATVGRQMWSMPDVIEEAASAGTLRDVVVIGVGANGLISQPDLDRVLDAVGDRQLVVVTASAPRSWIDESNVRLRETARAHRTVEVADWDATISTRLDLLAGDQVHPGPTGSALYSDEVRAALQRLADLPPPPDPDRYEDDPTLTRPI